MALLNIKGEGTYSKIENLQISGKYYMSFSVLTGNNWKKVQMLDGRVATALDRNNEETFELRNIEEIITGNIYDNLYNYLKTETYIKDLPFVDELGNTPTHKETEVTDPETGETHIEIVEV